MFSPFHPSVPPTAATPRLPESSLVPSPTASPLFIFSISFSLSLSLCCYLLDIAFFFLLQSLLILSIHFSFMPFFLFFPHYLEVSVCLPFFFPLLLKPCLFFCLVFTYIFWISHLLLSFLRSSLVPSIHPLLALIFFSFHRSISSPFLLPSSSTSTPDTRTFSSLPE